MKEIQSTRTVEIEGGLVFLIPPVVGGALKATGMAIGFVGGIGGGYAATKELFELLDRMTQ